MSRVAKDTYSISFGEERIEEIRSLSSLTRLPQADIFRKLWDEFKYQAIEMLLEDSEIDLQSLLKETQKNLRDFQKSIKS